MKILAIIFYICCFFPYIKLISGLDTQPNALILGSICFVIFFLNETKNSIYLWQIIIICFLTIYFFDINDVFLSFRGILNYYSLGIIGYVSYEFFKRDYYNIKLVKWTINTWFIIGLVQKFYSKNFLSFMLNHMRTSEGRGVTSLAPEPTFYGIMCIFFIILVAETFYSQKKIYILNLLIQIVFFSESSMTILFLLLWIFLIFIKNISYKKFFILIVSLVVIHICITTILRDTRVAYLYKNILDIKGIFYRDYSLNGRLSHIYYSIKGSFDNYILPNGFVEWKNYSYEESLRKTYFHTFGPTTASRIMSGFGGIIYELGIIGVYLIILITIIWYKGLKYKENALFLLIILFSSIQIANPMNGIILGLSLYKINLKKRRKNEKVKNINSSRNKTRNN